MISLKPKGSCPKGGSLMKMPRYLFLAVISFYVLIPALPAFSLAGPPPPAPPTSYQMPATSEAKASPEAAAAPTAETAETTLPVPTKEVKVVTPPSAVKESPKGGLYRVRTGIFSKKESAALLAAKIKSEGFSAVIVSQAGLYRVQVGAFKNPKGAEGLAAKLKAKGYATDIVVSD